MTDFLISNMPWVWFGIFALLIAFEVFTMSLISIWGAVSAFIMIFVARSAGINIKAQIIVFLLITIILIIAARPFTVKRLKLGKNDTNVNSIIGQEVIVLSPITQFQKGEAKGKNGVVWTATQADTQHDIPAGTVCTIMEVEGNTIKVLPKGGCATL